MGGRPGLPVPMSPMVANLLDSFVTMVDLGGIFLILSHDLKYKGVFNPLVDKSDYRFPKLFRNN